LALGGVLVDNDKKESCWNDNHMDINLDNSANDSLIDSGVFNFKKIK